MLFCVKEKRTKESQRSQCFLKLLLAHSWVNSSHIPLVKAGYRIQPKVKVVGCTFLCNEVTWLLVGVYNQSSYREGGHLLTVNNNKIITFGFLNITQIILPVKQNAKFDFFFFFGLYLSISLSLTLFYLSNLNAYSLPSSFCVLQCSECHAGLLLLLIKMTLCSNN